MLHCEVLQLPLYIGWGYGWCGMPGIGVCVCAVGKMAKDIGMTIRKSIVVSFLPCLVAFLAFHVFLLLVSVAFWGGGGGGGRKPWIVVVAQLQLAATYIREMQGNTGKDYR